MNSRKTRNRRGRGIRAPKNRGYQIMSQKGYSNKENIRTTFLDPHKYVTLKYVEEFSHSIATSAGAIQTMNLNSLFDPNRTGTGHQPYGFDTLATTYNRYRVLKVKYRVIFCSSSGSYMVGVGPVNGLIVSAVSDQATFQTFCETPRIISKVQSQGGHSVIISGRVSLNDLNGVTKIEYLGDDRFEAAIGASPTEVLTLPIGLFNPTGSTVITPYHVEMEFEVDFHDPIALSSSFDDRKLVLKKSPKGNRIDPIDFKPENQPNSQEELINLQLIKNNEREAKKTAWLVVPDINSI